MPRGAAILLALVLVLAGCAGEFAGSGSSMPPSAPSFACDPQTCPSGAKTLGGLSSFDAAGGAAGWD